MTDIPAIGGQHVLTALIQNCIQNQLVTFLGDIVGHAVTAGVKMTCVQIVVLIHVGHDATAVWIFLELSENIVHLVDFFALVDELFADGVSIGCTDRAGFIGPCIPNVGFQVMDVVGFLLVNPKDFIHSRFQCDATKGHCGEFFP